MLTGFLSSVFKLYVSYNGLALSIRTIGNEYIVFRNFVCAFVTGNVVKTFFVILDSIPKSIWHSENTDIFIIL